MLQGAVTLVKKQVLFDLSFFFCGIMPPTCGHSAYMRTFRLHADIPPTCGHSAYMRTFRLHAHIPPTCGHSSLHGGHSVFVPTFRSRADIPAYMRTFRLHADIPLTLHVACAYMRIIRLHVTDVTPRGNDRLHYMCLPLTCQTLLALAEARALA